MISDLRRKWMQGEYGMPPKEDKYLNMKHYQRHLNKYIPLVVKQAYKEAKGGY